MKLIIPVIFVIIILIAIGAYLYLNPQLIDQLFKTNPPVKDCGTNYTCFGEAFETCSPAKISMNLYVLEMMEQINGKDGSDCILYAKITQATNSSLVGLDMSCRIPMVKLNTTLSDMNDYCSGSLITYIEQMS